MSTRTNGVAALDDTKIRLGALEVRMDNQETQAASNTAEIGGIRTLLWSILVGIILTFLGVIVALALELARHK